MHALKDILIVILLCVLVTMTCLQEGDILGMKHRIFVTEGGLRLLYGGLNRHLNQSRPINGGLAPVDGGLPYLEHLRAATASIETDKIITGQNVFGPTSYLGTARGTAVFVSDNVLVTAKHCVENRVDDLSTKVTASDGVTYTSREVLEDSDDDLALIVIEGRAGPCLNTGTQPALGAELICIGSPLTSGQLIISWARLSREKYENYFIYDGFCNYGCSGGPIISGGKLVGVVNARLNTQPFLGFAAPIDRLDPDLMDRIR
jgi:S1-C subfamily serine protease